MIPWPSSLDTLGTILAIAAPIAVLVVAVVVAIRLITGRN